MRHEFAHISQNDPAWKSVFLGTSSSVNLGQAGCYITSFSCVAAYYGHTITPPALNNLLIEKGLFAQEDLVSDDNDLEKVFPDIKYTTSFYFPNVPPTPANLVQLQELLKDPTTCVIVQIDLGNGSSHFTPVIDCDGSSVMIMNVWDGKEEDFKTVYGDPATKILKYVVYHGNPLFLDPLVCDRKSVRDHIIEKASQWDDIVNHGYSSPQAIYDRISSLVDQNNTLINQAMKSKSVSFSAPGTIPDVSATTAIPEVSPVLQPDKTSFWHMDIAGLFKLFTKGGNK